ncbi:MULTISPECIES: hypothetical protein [Pseudoalteromonas]|uniref:Uncharacterized protein n=1 Tax=Pseudoalteromonas spongiae TaxID=298657 RepID=A0ABU8ETC4_9GAMM|nr:hypothetical protein [Pseudoalteromonas sp. T1lg24]
MLSDKTLNVLTAIVNNEIREKAYIRSVQTGVVENGILQQMDLEIAELHKICYELINYKSNLQQHGITIVKTSLEATVHALKSSKVAN